MASAARWCTTPVSGGKRLSQWVPRHQRRLLANCQRQGNRLPSHSCLSTVYLLLAHAYSQAGSTCQELLPARHPPPTPVCWFGLKGPRVLHLTVQGLLKGQAGGYALTLI